MVIGNACKLLFVVVNYQNVMEWYTMQLTSGQRVWFCSRIASCSCLWFERSSKPPIPSWQAFRHRSNRKLPPRKSEEHWAWWSCWESVGSSARSLSGPLACHSCTCSASWIPCKVSSSSWSGVCSTTKPDTLGIGIGKPANEKRIVAKSWQCPKCRRKMDTKSSPERCRKVPQEWPKPVLEMERTRCWLKIRSTIMSQSQLIRSSCDFCTNGNSSTNHRPQVRSKWQHQWESRDY